MITENTDLVDEIAVRDAVIRDLQSQLQQSIQRTGDPAECEEAPFKTMDACALRELMEELLAAHDKPIKALLRETRDRLLRHEEATQSAIYDLQDGLTLQSTHLTHTYVDAEQRKFVRQVREKVRALLPPDAMVLIASRGDPELLNLYSRRASPFPQGPDGCYYPNGFANANTAIMHLEALRARGAQYLVLPGTSRSILNDLPEFKSHLDARFRLLVNEEICCIYSLRESPLATSTPLPSQMSKHLAECEYRLQRSPSVLDWHTGLDLVRQFPEHILFSPPSSGPSLPYMSESIDVVVLASTDVLAIAEARRVASTAVISIVGQAHLDGEALTVEWKAAETINSKPTISIVLPAVGNIAMTEATLRAVIETLPDKFQGDIVIVDDAGTTAEVRHLRRLVDWDKRIKLLRNINTSGFAACCNRAARVVQGEIVVFVQSGTVPMPGWLNAVQETFRIFPDAGAVGGKIFSAEGMLMQAGGILFDDGSIVNDGAGECNVHAQIYRHVRRVDFCSSDLFAVKRCLFEGEGGFDIQCCVPSLRDADFGLYLNSKSHHVYLQPECLVIRLTSNGGNCGTEEDTTDSRAAFVRKWGSSLKRRSPPRRIVNPAGGHSAAIGQSKSGGKHGA